MKIDKLIQELENQENPDDEPGNPGEEPGNPGEEPGGGDEGPGEGADGEGSKNPGTVNARLAPVLKTIFINMSYHILLASLTLMALS